jgi:hypothetical protein
MLSAAPGNEPGLLGRYLAMTKQGWSDKYSAVLSERNRGLLLVRIDDAGIAIMERLREVPESSEERGRLDYAMKILSMLRQAS